MNRKFRQHNEIEQRQRVSVWKKRGRRVKRGREKSRHAREMYVWPDLSWCLSSQLCVYVPYLSLFRDARRVRALAYNKLIISFCQAETKRGSRVKKTQQEENTRNKTQAVAAARTQANEASRCEKMKREDNDRYNRYTIFVLFKTMG